jgi:hypothetical protein
MLMPLLHLLPVSEDANILHPDWLDVIGHASFGQTDRFELR